ncbi:MAG: ABC transporter permease [Spirochaetaceae bacterium]|nr:ABC transporter permease [Spirochaetaceae bacterium]
MLEDFLNALKYFKTHKLRTFLSLLGIVIGITAVIVITTLGSSLYGSLISILKNNTTNQTNMCTVSPNWNPETHQISFKVNETYRKGLYRGTNKIKKIFYTNNISTMVLRGSVELDNMYSTQQLIGVEPDWLEYKKIELAYGRYFTLDDHAESRQRVILGSTLAEKLFPEGNALGKKCVLSFITYGPRGQTPHLFFFEVIGVITKNVSNGIYGNSDTRILVPRRFITKLKNTTEADEIEVFFADETDYNEVKSHIHAYSDTFSNSSNSVYVYGIIEQMDAVNQVLTMVQIILSAIAFISLFVGGINIMNIMIATVTERKKEIGIRKALGATNQNITIQFLVEAASLSFLGGILGSIIGLLISFITVKFIPTAVNLAEIEFIINVTGLVVASSVSVLIGIFFGLRPARKAAKLDPIKALS